MAKDYAVFGKGDWLRVKTLHRHGLSEVELERQGTVSEPVIYGGDVLVKVLQNDRVVLRG